jgi:hypothetical protein
MSEGAIGAEQQEKLSSFFEQICLISAFCVG